MLKASVGDGMVSSRDQRAQPEDRRQQVSVPGVRSAPIELCQENLNPYARGGPYSGML